MNAKHSHDAAIVLSARGHESIDDLNMPFEKIKFESTSFTDHEYDLLFDLFTDFNKSFNIIIDTYEEEEIPRSGITKAIELTRRYLLSGSKERKDATAKLLAVLERAHSLSAPILLSF